VVGRAAAGHGAVLEVVGLRKAYGTRTALDGVDLEVTAGEVLALLGSGRRP